MIVVLFIGLYSSRVILNSLGVVDYGIYNVVGSLVVMFSYMDSALSQSATRFYSYDLPNGIERVKVVFNTSLIIQLVFASIIIIIAETIGLWLVNNKLVVPADRLSAANWVFQFSVISTIIVILSAPFNASITSHERMSVYAVLSIIEAVFKLTVALLISESPIDKLVFYSSGLLMITIFVFVMKTAYCRGHFEEIRIERKFSKPLLKKMFSFVGWNFFGATAGMSVGQGLNFIINIFFGPAINAARGVAFQVQGAINQFVTNINTAVNPQIVKRYSVGEVESMFRLVFFASKVSFLLLLFISMPIIVDAPYILEVWLKEVPDQAVLFTRLMLIYMLTIAVVYSVNMSAQASGNIKSVQIAEGTIILMNIPAVLILFYMGMPAYTSFLSMIFFSILAFMARLVILSKTIHFPVKEYVKEVVSRLVSISFVCVLIYILVAGYTIFNLRLFLVKTVMYMIPLFLIMWLVGLDKKERLMVKTLIMNKLTKH